MSFTLTTSGAAILKAGIDVNSDLAISGAAMANFSDQAEGDIVVKTRRNWVTAYATLPDSIKQTLDDACSSKMAKAMISYDMGNYNSTLEATTLLDVNDDIYGKAVSTLKQFTLGDIKTP